MTSTTVVSTQNRRWLRQAPLLLPLLVALVVRVAAWWMLPYEGQISDEAEYLAAATWLANGRGFAFYKEWIWTRPPLYLIFLAAHIRLFGTDALGPIRISQTLISVATVGLTMVWGARLAPPGAERRVALLSGWAMALCYSFATYAFLLLSETLFLALLILGFLLLTLWAEAPNTMRWRRAAFLAAAGGALALASLTRGMLLGAMPLLAAWVWWQAARGQRAPLFPSRASRHTFAPWRGVTSAALFTVAVSAVILPWSIWNTRFFGGDGLILVDTTGGYNALLGAQAARQEIAPSPDCGRTEPRCEEAIYKLLKAIDSHAERQSQAYTLAAEWIAANPLGFMRKVGREFVDMLVISYGGAERLRSGYTEGLIPIPHLLSLLSDDALYFVATPLAALGLARTQRRPGKGLACLWLAYNLVTGPLFFAINRFRVPLLPILFIYAACAIVQRRALWRGRTRRTIGFAGTVGLLLFLLPSFAYWGDLRNGFPASGGSDRSILRNTFLGVRAGIVAEDCRRAAAALARDDLAAAQRLVDRGSARRIRGSNGLTCFALLQAQIDTRQGEYKPALALLQIMDRTPERFLLEGDIFRRMGRPGDAINPFVAPELENDNPTGWAWRNLAPPPAARIDLGSGLDWGYIDGFSGREGRAEDPDNYRWTGPRSRLRLVDAGSGAPQTLRMRIRAVPRAAVDPPSRLTVRTPAAGANCRAGACVFDVAPAWQTVEAPLPATPAGEDVVVELESTTVVSDPGELAQRQQVRDQLRLLGVQVDWAELVAADGS